MSQTPTNTTTNKAYMRWYRRDFGGLRAKLRDYNERFNEERDAVILAEKKRRQPRVRKGAVYKDLPDDVFAAILNELRDKYLPGATGVQVALTAAQALREKRLNELAETVVVEPDETCWHLVAKCSTSAYRSQTRPHEYARCSLLPQAAAIAARGGDTHISYATTWSSQGGRGVFGYNAPSSGGEYQLWANCPKWVADAIYRCITIDEALAALPSTANAKVLMPFLDHERFEKHMMGGYKKRD